MQFIQSSYIQIPAPGCHPAPEISTNHPKTDICLICWLGSLKHGQTIYFWKACKISRFKFIFIFFSRPLGRGSGAKCDFFHLKSALQRRLKLKTISYSCLATPKTPYQTKSQYQKIAPRGTTTGAPGGDRDILYLAQHVLYQMKDSDECSSSTVVTLKFNHLGATQHPE